jgi:predicted nucleic acid-binding Zn ribbon protein
MLSQQTSTSTVINGRKACPKCGKAFYGGKATKRFCSDSCRVSYHTERARANERAEVICRHMESMKAELAARKLHPFGCACGECL